MAATIVVTMTAGEARWNCSATTQPARWLEGDDNREGPGRRTSITHYSDVLRCFTEQQRLAMIARDGGCSFPGCDVAPGWCEAHHLIPWQDSRRTSVDNGTLVCGYHHREHERLGWHAELINGRVGWIPPKWLDRAESYGLSNASVKERRGP